MAMAMAMGFPRSLLKLTVTLAFIFSLSLPLPSSVDGGGSPEKKAVLGSRPPACLNRCSNCRPCTAALVVPVHHERTNLKALSNGEDNGGYYVVHWKCRCGNKVYQP